MKALRFMFDMQNAETGVEHNAALRVMQIAYASGMESPRRTRRRERLALLVKAAGGPQKFAQEVGTPVSYVSALLNGSRGLGDALAAKIEACYGKSSGWFDLPGDAETVASVAPPNTVDVPVLRRAESQRVPEYPVKRLTLSRTWVSRMLEDVDPKSLRFMHAWRDGMEPTIGDGDLLLLTSDVRVGNLADGIFALYVGEEVHIRRLSRNLTTGHLEISRDAPTAKSVDLMPSDATLAGRILWIFASKQAV